MVGGEGNNVGAGKDCRDEEYEEGVVVSTTDTCVEEGTLREEVKVSKVGKPIIRGKKSHVVIRMLNTIIAQATMRRSRRPVPSIGNIWQVNDRKFSPIKKSLRFASSTPLRRNHSIFDSHVSRLRPVSSFSCS